MTTTLKGFDAAREVGSLAAALAADHTDFVLRYYSYNAPKNLSALEAQRLGAAGIRIGTVFEARGDLIGSFSVDQARRDAGQALQLAVGCGQPEGSAIYFAVDLDPTPKQIGNAVVPYFQVIKAALAGRYKPGVYGSGLVCATLRQLGLAEYFWLACAAGWQGSKTFTGWHIRQSLPQYRYDLGFSIDPDEAVAGDNGLFLPVAAPPDARSAAAAVPPAKTA